MNDSYDNLDEKLQNNLLAHETHQKRLKMMAEKFVNESEKLRVLHQLVANTLTYHGLDTEEFTAEHNRVFEGLYGVAESIGETLVDLGNDVQEILSIYGEEIEDVQKRLEELREEK